MTGLVLPDFAQLLTLQSSESDVEQRVVLPLLRALGYGDVDWQAQAVIGKVRVDFLVQPTELKATYPPYLLVEAKAPNRQISQSVWQLNNYVRQSGAVFGLLTNGYSFRILYNYDQQIIKILEYNQAELSKNSNFFLALLGKSTCLKLRDALYRSQNQVHLNLLKNISKRVASEEMLQLFKKIQSSSGKQKSTEMRRDTMQQEKHAMIVTVFNNKGGVGKTTTTVNLAAALSKLGKRVLLIDIDAQANLTTGLGIDPLNDVELQGRKDISHLLTETKTLLPSTVYRKRWEDVELDIVPSHIRLSEMESTLIQTVDVDRVLIKKLKNYRKDYDFILIDPPPSFGKVNTISLMASSGVLIPTQLAPYPVRALEYVIGRVLGVGETRDEPLPILGIAVSMYDRRLSVLKQDMHDKIIDMLNKIPGGQQVNIFPETTWIPQLKIVSLTPDKGYPLCHAEFDSDLTAGDKEAAQVAFDCYMKMAKHLVTITQEKD